MVGLFFLIDDSYVRRLRASVNSQPCFLVGQARDRQMPTYYGRAGAAGPASVASPFRERHFQGLADFQPLWAHFPPRRSQQARPGLHAASPGSAVQVWVSELPRSGPLQGEKHPSRLCPVTPPEQGLRDLSPSLGWLAPHLWSPGATESFIIIFILLATMMRS